MTEKTDKNELRIIGDIEEASSFDELYEILRKKYQAGNMIDNIAQIREDLEDSRREEDIGELTPKGVGRFMLENESLKRQILNITRKEGLRTRVMELAIKEIMSKQ